MDAGARPWLLPALLCACCTRPALAQIPPAPEPLGLGRECLALSDMVVPALAVVRAPAGGVLRLAAGRARSIRRARLRDSKGQWQDITAAVAAGFHPGADFNVAVNSSGLGIKVDTGSELVVQYQLADRGGLPDYTRADLAPPGVAFFTQRGLDPRERYGCSAPVHDDGHIQYGPLQFALQCSCPSGHTCKPLQLNYMHGDQRGNSKMGQCGCCSPRVVLGIIVAAVAAFCVAAGLCVRPARRCFTWLLVADKARYREVRRQKRRASLRIEGFSAGNDVAAHMQEADPAASASSVERSSDGDWPGRAGAHRRRRHPAPSPCTGAAAATAAGMDLPGGQPTEPAALPRRSGTPPEAALLGEAAAGHAQLMRGASVDAAAAASTAVPAGPGSPRLPPPPQLAGQRRSSHRGSGVTASAAPFREPGGAAAPRR
eukprot:TRINITY_DN40549_c0_g1_i1.p1 TRINITY_DN40549_c0_g1~~TRINITY_DN40549_c0_g1_i1.p1  ORF type:complete len:459 (+),score=86.08 TRINITY_DN40549_c0_g1_i1:89-1378(+)